MIKKFKDQPTKVEFRPEHFGGYNIFLMLTGLFFGFGFYKHWLFFIIGVVSFFGSCYFYAKSQEYFKEEEEEGYIDIESQERENIYN